MSYFTESLKACKRRTMPYIDMDNGDVRVEGMPWWKAIGLTIYFWGVHVYKKIV